MRGNLIIVDQTLVAYERSIKTVPITKKENPLVTTTGSKKATLFWLTSNTTWCMTNTCGML